MKRGVLFLLILILGIPSVISTDYYVSKNGNDGNGGTSWLDSWITIEQADASVPAN